MNIFHVKKRFVIFNPITHPNSIPFYSISKSKPKNNKLKNRFPNHPCLATTLKKNINKNYLHRKKTHNTTYTTQKYTVSKNQKHHYHTLIRETQKKPPFLITGQKNTFFFSIFFTTPFVLRSVNTADVFGSTKNLLRKMCRRYACERDGVRVFCEGDREVGVRRGRVGVGVA